MQAIKKILFPLFALFLLFRTFELLKHLYYSRAIDYGYGESALIAFLITLFVTGIFAFPGFVFPTSKIMPTQYWKATNPDRLNGFFDTLGVNTFKSILVLLFWGRHKNRKKYYNGTRTGLQNFLYQTKQSEFGHLGALIIITIISIVLLAHGYVMIVCVMTVFNLFGNLYPIILQRHHRIRIYRLLKHIS